ncbi:hypothetical protein L210DRAFT_3513072 [Boletus edulis BED1]|uniref:Uncharacterized protein n=1 Tax=Boletus edulis BED1 TaxID=1328754 RepID=A0AAD4G5C4_BOLED|nr:hypothetical protein L210DRAFT_3513072 [Boletus edulis BED1]
MSWHSRSSRHTVNHPGFPLDDRFLAVGGDHLNISLKALSCTIEPDMRVDDAALTGNSWKNDDQLTDVEVLFTTVVHKSWNQTNLLVGLLFKLFWNTGMQCLLILRWPLIVHPAIVGCITKSVAHFLSDAYPLGYHRIYGGRVEGCNIAPGQSHRYGALQLDVLHSSGKAIMCNHPATITASTFDRHIYVISSQESIICAHGGHTGIFGSESYWQNAKGTDHVHSDYTACTTDILTSVT